MDLNHRIADVVTPSIEAMGFELVRAQVSGARRPVVQIMCDRPDGSGITIDDCAAISRTVSAVLDVEDPIADEYTLEVSSPGIDRPLVRRKDFERFAGHLVKVELGAAHDGRRRFTGTLAGLDGDAVCVATEDGDVKLPYDEIQKAKLVLTDELLAAAAQPGS